MISNSIVPSRVDCSFECLNSELCVSYNYEEGNKALHECQLNNERKGKKLHKFSAKAGYAYYEKSVSSLSYVYYIFTISFFFVPYPHDSNNEYINFIIPSIIYCGAHIFCSRFPLCACHHLV